MVYISRNLILDRRYGIVDRLVCETPRWRYNHPMCSGIRQRDPGSAPWFRRRLDEECAWNRRAGAPLATEAAINVGGSNTTVLMVLHVPNAGRRSTLISIPRDDYTTLVGSPDGVSHEKIKQGYGLAKDAKEKQLRGHGVTDRQTLESQGRDAGRKQ